MNINPVFIEEQVTTDEAAIPAELLDRIKDVQILRLQPGDQVIFHMPRDTRPVDIDRLRAWWMKTVGAIAGVPMILSEDVEVSILRKDEADA